MSDGLLGAIAQRFTPRQTILYGGILLTFALGHIRGVADGYPGPAEEAAQYALESGLMWSFWLFVLSALMVGAGTLGVLWSKRGDA